MDGWTDGWYKWYAKKEILFKKNNDRHGEDEIYRQTTSSTVISKHYLYAASGFRSNAQKNFC